MQKSPIGGQRGVMSRDVPPDASSLGSILAKRCMCTHGRILRYTRYGLWTRQITVSGQRRPERNSPYKWLYCHEGATQWLSIWVCLLSIPRVLNSSLPSKYFTCFTTFHLCGKSFLQSQRARALVTDHWSKWLGLGVFTTVIQPMSGWKSKSHPKPLKTETTLDQY